MKNCLALLLLMGALQMTQAQDTKIAPYLVKELAADAIQKIHAETNGGNIIVSATDASPRIEVYIWSGNGRSKELSKEEINKRLENYELKVAAENHTLTATARAKKGFRDWKNNLSISFTIYVGKEVSTDLQTSGGNISLSGLAGTQDFTTSGGNITVDHLSGHVKGRTSGGNIRLTELQDDIDLSTSGGNINAENSHGTLHLSTSGGSLVLNNLQGNIHASTSGGNVRADNIEGDLSAHTSGGNVDMDNLSCSLETSTSGGNITVNIKKLGKFVKITNSGGRVNLQVPEGQGMDVRLSADRVNATALAGFKGDIKEDRIDGALNGGGIPVTVRGGSSIHFSVK
ncbi:MAG TPA: DUF4097 family beta strand repeat-containing protein [Chitinophagaceae bacterium]|nr:DUF4097 family beta strand repeat-containing protein [Chitinophagaceae bacterium]